MPSRLSVALRLLQRDVRDCLLGFVLATTTPSLFITLATDYVEMREESLFLLGLGFDGTCSLLPNDAVVL